jgi:DNA-directed RNA polymerase specialized sigma subunit
METLSDSDLIKSIKKKKKVDECLQELIDRHSGIYLDIVNSFLRNCNNDSLREEIINDKEYAIYNSVLKYDENRGTKFSTFLGNEAKWICLNASNKNKKYVELNDNTYDFECIKDTYEHTVVNFQDQILKEFNEEINKHPDKRIQKIFSMRYSGNKKLTPWRKISKAMNLSIQGCINIHNAALNSISKNIRSKYEIISQRSN